MKLLHVFREPVDAPFARVAEVMVSMCQKQLAGYALTPVSPGKFQARSPGHTMTVEIDAQQGFFAMQGGWWYRYSARCVGCGA